MAPESWRKTTSVAQRLFGEPHRFSFHQAVRLLGRIALQRARDGDRAAGYPVGHDHPPAEEVVRFRTLQALSFAASEITKLVDPRSPKTSKQPKDSPPEMTVTFLGLTGPNGALPDHYTTLFLQRLREKDDSLYHFFDLFNHRTISLFYRAWEKYRLPISYESAALSDGDDLATQALYSLVGLGTNGLRGRQSVCDEAILFYAGHFSEQSRSAITLEEMLRVVWLQADQPTEVE